MRGPGCGRGNRHLSRSFSEPPSCPSLAASLSAPTPRFPSPSLLVLLLRLSLPVSPNLPPSSCLTLSLPHPLARSLPLLLSPLSLPSPLPTASSPDTAPVRPSQTFPYRPLSCFDFLLLQPAIGGFLPSPTAIEPWRWWGMCGGGGGSVIIGMDLGALAGKGGSVAALTAANCLHQLFEGLGLGHDPPPLPSPPRARACPLPTHTPTGTHASARTHARMRRHAFAHARCALFHAQRALARTRTSAPARPHPHARARESAPAYTHTHIQTDTQVGRGHTRGAKRGPKPLRVRTRAARSGGQSRCAYARARSSLPFPPCLPPPPPPPTEVRPCPG